MQEVYWQLGGEDNHQFSYNYPTWFTSAVRPDTDMADEFQTGTYEDGPHLGPSVRHR